MLTLENVSISYGPIRAVRNVSLTVSQGEIVTLLGPNGAGKSTTLSAIVGLQPVASGRIVFDGRPITSMATEQLVRLGLTLTPEGRRVFAGLTVEENLRLGAASRRDRKAVAKTQDEIFDLFPILKDRLQQLAGSLSGGEQQQLAIARSLASAPKLLLLDEPSLGLAPQIVDQIFDLIVELRRRGLTILLVEQNTELSLEVSDRGYVYTNGEISLSGTSKELRESDDVAAAYLGMEA
ncbi:MAG: ABC transporter ATP-binding protein [Deltaproteobacteria bacterium]|jgi:branched-chain amino acid transport system ATP-binding protein|nr:ABC transporter ATP-binding protein [Deltaproteobacteria bacterium]MBT4644728.1 ABC transporter ATP-binding protein [Deltaproteobacteria bacterium]MBT6504691.1 ABC transporter ATP-binding protein [Deltaproteobacteria bacterium]MBT6614605.1 ABC transporter ATP-binding protein [Deltaproteobacteria bacterium]MBT7153891.1 ABC transporter ATP-binding protein [Deltaproteobacteria bacterium]